MSKIAKQKWWWKYYSVTILDTTFHKGKHRDGDIIWNEYYKCKVFSHYKFERYADKLKTSITALSDHIIKYYHLTENHDSESVLSGPTNSGIRSYLTVEDDNPTVEEALLDWITYSNKPFTVTENPWFIRMLRATGYHGRILKGDAIKAKLEARIDNVITQIIQDIEKTATTVCLTLDGWTSKNQKAILAINIR